MKNIPLVIDFDGTIAEHSYPAIGEPVPHAFETMKQWQKEGALLILFTMRSGKELADAVNFCKEMVLCFTEFKPIPHNHNGHHHQKLTVN